MIVQRHFEGVAAIAATRQPNLQDEIAVRQDVSSALRLAKLWQMVSYAAFFISLVLTGIALWRGEKRQMAFFCAFFLFLIFILVSYLVV
jgi:type IV secretory pathway TrbF-like protein